MGTINGIDIGNQLEVSLEERQLYERRYGATMTLEQALVAEDATWIIVGSKSGIASVLEAQANSIKNLRYLAQPAFLNLTDKYSWLKGFVKVSESRAWMESGILRYQLRCLKIGAIGICYIQTEDIYLHDYPLYMGRLKVLDPFAGRSEIAYASNAGPTYEYTWNLYVDNDKNGVQTAILEIQTGDDLSKLQIRAYKSTGWTAVGDWGGADAWGDSKNFVDDAAVTHAFKAETGTLGAATATIGTCSQMPGCNKRILVSITQLQADSGASADLSTDDENDQVILEIKLIHTRREAARPYPIITFDDGSLGGNIPA